VGRVARQRIALRLLLLVVTAIGIAGMHTLGHPGDAGTGGSVHGAAMPLGEESMAEAAGAGCPTPMPGPRSPWPGVDRRSLRGWDFGSPTCRCSGHRSQRVGYDRFVVTGQWQLSAHQNHLTGRQ
jgi:hypothetical protein